MKYLVIDEFDNAWVEEKPLHPGTTEAFLNGTVLIFQFDSPGPAHCEVVSIVLDITKDGVVELENVPGRMPYADKQ